MKRLIFITAVLSMFALACGDENENNSTENNDPNTCTTTRDYYKANVVPIFEGKCNSCHGGNGIGASGSELKLNKDDLSDDATRTSVKDVANKMEGGQSILLLKATNESPHTGGPQITKDSAEYNALKELVDRINTPKECDSDNPF